MSARGLRLAACVQTPSPFRCTARTARRGSTRTLSLALLVTAASSLGRVPCAQQFSPLAARGCGAQQPLPLAARRAPTRTRAHVAVGGNDEGDVAQTSRQKGVNANDDELRSFAAVRALLPAGAVSLDCEMVKVRNGKTGERFALGQCCILDVATEEPLYESYVKPDGEVVDYLTRYSGLSDHNLRSATPFAEARAQILELIKGRVIIGHGLENDFKVLGIRPESSLIYDTSLLEWGPRISLKLRDLVRDELALEIQTGAHSPREDASAALRLYAHYLSIGPAAARQPRSLRATLHDCPPPDAGHPPDYHLPEFSGVPPSILGVSLPRNLRLLTPAAGWGRSVEVEFEWTRAGVKYMSGENCQIALPPSLHKDTRRRLHTSARAVRLHVSFARGLFDACGSAGGELCRYSANELAEMSLSGEFEAEVAALMERLQLQPPTPSY
ncbi:ribonuclease H-like domain-containing protein [Pavlovales sp. CCMP2436]|nr:ribonuclease H-like domain-containing protein [Pavlovales sp. CCMP2436]